MGTPRSNESRNTPYVVGHEWSYVPAEYSDTTTLGSRFRYSRTWSGTRTPNFQRIKAGQLPINNHSVVIRSVNSDRLVRLQTDTETYKVTHPGFVWYDMYHGAFTDKYGNTGGLPGHIPEADNKAIQKLIDAAQAGITANMAQNFAQYSQLTTMIGGTATAIAKSVRALRKGNFAGAVNVLLSASNGHRYAIKKGSPSIKKSLANNWLAIQYGWKPLLADIDGAFQALGTLSNRQALGSQVVHRVTASASASTETSSRFTIANYPALDGGSTLQSVQTRTRYGICYRVSDPTAAYLQQMGFTNPINLLWEILPYSFVVDWFLPIGPFLESLDYSRGLVFVKGFQTRFTRVQTASAVAFNGRISGSNLDMAEAGDYRREDIILDRVGLDSFPSMTFPTPRMGINNSNSGITRAANAIALMAQAFKG